MAGSTISGNVGGAAASGAQIQLLNIRTKDVLFSSADGSGAYSFGSLVSGKYQVTAFLVNFVYYHVRHITADGSSTYADQNLNPTALNASNVNSQAGNF